MEYIKTISNLLNFHKIFGYIPIRLNQKLSKSPFTFIYGSTILIWYTTLLVEDSLQPRTFHQINSIINLLKLICSAINTYINILSTWIYSTKLIIMLKKFCKLLNKFKELGIFLDVRKANTFGWILIVISIIILSAVGLITWFLNMGENSSDVMRFILLFTPMILNTFTITQIAIWCYLFRECFECLNKLLQFRLRTQYSSRISTFNSKTIIGIGTTEKALIYNNLDEIGKSYFLMKNLMEDFTQIYSCQDLAIFATSFTVNTCFLYYFVYVSTTVEEKIYLLTWIAFHFCEIIINVLTRYFVVKKVKASSEAFNKNVENSFYCFTDERFLLQFIFTLIE